MPPLIGLSNRAFCVAGESVISVLMAKALGHPELISLAAGFVDQESLPVEPTRKAMEALLADSKRAKAALQYGTTVGLPALRDQVLERMLQADGCSAKELNVSLDNVVLTAGSNQLLFHLGDVLFNPGDIVICAAPTYFVYLGTLRNLGVRAVGVESDRRGLIPEAVEEELRRRKIAGELSRVKAIYVTTYFDNPCGTTVCAARRAALVEMAKRWSQENRIYLIEDSAYRELRYYGEDLPSLRSFDPEGDTVICAGTFSKSFSPGIRVGWGILPPSLLGSVVAEKGNFDFGSPNFNQQLMTTIIELGLFDEHVELLRKKYREKVDGLNADAEEFLRPLGGIDWERPDGGLYVWLKLPEDIDTGLDSPLFNAAIEEGVIYIPGECCYPAEGAPRPKNRIRLSFGVPSRENIRRGIEALGRAMQRVMGRK